MTGLRPQGLQRTSLAIYQLELWRINHDPLVLARGGNLSDGASQTHLFGERHQLRRVLTGHLNDHANFLGK